MYNSRDKSNEEEKQIIEIECNKNISKKVLNALLTKYVSRGEIYTVKPNNGEEDFEFKIYYIEGSTVKNLFDPRGTLQNLEDVTFYNKEGILEHLKEQYKYTFLDETIKTFTNPEDLKIILTLARNINNLKKQITEKDEELTEVRNELTEVRDQLDKETDQLTELGKRKEPQGLDTQEEDTQLKKKPKPRALVKCKGCDKTVIKLRFGFDKGPHKYQARFCSSECAGDGSFNVIDLKCTKCKGKGLTGNAAKKALYGPLGGKRLRCKPCAVDGDVEIKTGTK